MGELMVSEIVQNKVLEANNNEIVKAKSKGYTILGDIAIAIENSSDMMMECADVFSKYIASNVNYKLVKRYEENSNFWERYVCNDSSKIQQLRNQQEFANYLVVNGVRVATGVGKIAITKALDYFDVKKMKDSLWVMSKKYANMISGQNWNKYPGVLSYLRYLSNQLYGKTKAVGEGIDEGWDHELVLPNENNYKNIAFVLYMIYSQKHLFNSEAESKIKDTALLFTMWERIGIFRSEAIKLFKEFLDIDSTIGYDFVNTNIIMRGVVNNLSVALPVANTKLVNQLNRESLKYIPNGDTQEFSRRTARFLTKSAICVGTLYGGMETGNLAMIEEATKSALSLFDNLDNSEKVGNSLEALGLDPKMISECLAESRNRIKKSGVAIIDVKSS